MAGFLSSIGVVFAIVAGYFIHAAYSIEITVRSVEAPPGFDGIANLQAMHLQGADLAIGIGAAIVASVFTVGAAIVAALDRRTNDSVSVLASAQIA